MRENCASAGGTAIMSNNSDNSFIRTSSRRIPRRSATPVRNSHSKSAQSQQDKKSFAQRSSSLISRRKKVVESSDTNESARTYESAKSYECNQYTNGHSQDKNSHHTDTYDLLTGDLVNIKRSLLYLSRVLVQQNGESHAGSSNGHSCVDDSEEDEKTIRDLKERVHMLQRETEEKNKVIEKLRNEINYIKHGSHGISRSTQTEHHLSDIYNNNHYADDSKILVRTCSDSTPQKSSSKLSKVPILPWRHGRSSSSSRKK